MSKVEKIEIVRNVMKRLYGKYIEFRAVRNCDLAYSFSNSATVQISIAESKKYGNGQYFHKANMGKNFDIFLAICGGNNILFTKEELEDYQKQNREKSSNEIFFEFKKIGNNWFDIRSKKTPILVNQYCLAYYKLLEIT